MQEVEKCARSYSGSSCRAREGSSFVRFHSCRNARCLIPIAKSGGAIDDSAEAEPHGPAFPTQAALITAFEQIRERAASAVAAAGDDSHENRLSSSAALESALEAADMSNDEISGLAAALATLAAASYSHLMMPSAAARQSRCRVAWNAVARALTRPQWPPPPSPVVSSARDGGNTAVDASLHLRGWSGLKLPVPCKQLLSGAGGLKDGAAQVTCLTYLPLAMLLASGHADGQVRLWDPCARKHKLAPSPPPRGGVGERNHRYSSTGEYGRSGLGEGKDRHLRIWPGNYIDTAEEWTENGQTFGCVAEFGAVTTRGGNAVGSESDGVGGGGILKVSALDAITIPGGNGVSLAVCDIEGARGARAMDEQEPWDPASTGV